MVSEPDLDDDEPERETAVVLSWRTGEVSDSCCKSSLYNIIRCCTREPIVAMKALNFSCRIGVLVRFICESVT